MPKGQQNTRSRNRERTEASLIEAVGAVIARDGVAALSATAVAEQAGVDRMLVNRYFGDLDGLLKRYASSRELCWRADELLDGLAVGGTVLARPALLVLVLLRYLRLLAARPVLLSILAAEIASPSGLTRAISTQRETEEKRLFGALGRLAGEALSPEELIGLKSYMSAIALELLRRRNTVTQGPELPANDLSRLEAAITLGAAAQFGAHEPARGE